MVGTMRLLEVPIQTLENEMSAMMNVDGFPLDCFALGVLATLTWLRDGGHSPSQGLAAFTQPVEGQPSGRSTIRRTH